MLVEVVAAGTRAIAGVEDRRAQVVGDPIQERSLASSVTSNVSVPVRSISPKSLEI